MQWTSGLSRTLRAGIVGLLAFAATSTGAYAQQPGFGSPSLDQYVESVPTGGGPSVSKPEKRGQSHPELPKATQRKLDATGGPDADTLNAIVSRPSLGAPKASSDAGGDAKSSSTRKRHPERHDGGSGGAAPTGSTPAPSALAAAGDAIGGSGSGGLVLVAGILLSTVVLIAARVRGRRQR